MVWVIVGAVEGVLEFLDGVEVDSVIDDVRVDYSVGIAFEKRRGVHHLVLVIAELLVGACQFRLLMSFEDLVGLSIARESIRSSNILGSAAAGIACASRVKRNVQAPCKSGDLCLLLDRVGFLVFKLVFKTGNFVSDQK